MSVPTVTIASIVEGDGEVRALPEASLSCWMLTMTARRGSARRS
jgi:hypothetical protein